MLYCNIFKVSVIVRNKSFGFCQLLLLLFRTGLDCEMDGTEKGGARERNPIWGEFDPICQRNLSSGAMSALVQKGKMKKLMLIARKNKGLVRTRRTMYPKTLTLKQLCKAKQKKRMPFASEIMSSGAMLAFGAKSENEEVDANCWENEGLMRT